MHVRNCRELGVGAISYKTIFFSIEYRSMIDEKYKGP